MHYWFRAVEKYAPWVRKIHFITCGQIPEWLNLEHPKLHFVRHEDYIPHQWLPTFSANPIELNMFRISGLSEKFVYFNDDTFLNAPVRPDDFFANGLPRTCAGLHPGPLGLAHPNMPECAHYDLNNIVTIVKNFDFGASFRANWPKWINPRYSLFVLAKTILLLPYWRFTGFHDWHAPNAFLKSTFIEVWDKEEKLLERASSQRFRSFFDVTQLLMKDWQIASGKFYPVNPKIAKSYRRIGQFKAFVDDIKFHKHKLICLNDYAFYEKVQEIRALYGEVFPEKSSFEV